MSAIANLCAGVGRPPDLRAGREVLWNLDEHDAAHAGAGRITAFAELPDAT
jgi:hypothetical protein